MWLTLKDFSEIHNISANSVHVKHNQQKDLEWIKKEGGLLYVDQAFLIKRFEYKKQLSNIAQDYLSYLVTVLPDVTANNVAIYFSKKFPEYSYSSWKNFFELNIFSIVNDKITATYISPKLEKFIEHFETVLIRKIHWYLKNNKTYKDKLKEFIYN